MADQAGTKSPSQTGYVPSDYSNTSWEILDDVRLSEDFEPMDVEVLDPGASVVDPFFRDYGGRSKEQGSRRWHVPDDSEYTQQINSRREAEAESERRQSLLPEEIEAIKAHAFAAGVEHATRESSAAHAVQVEQQTQRLAQLLSELQQQLEQTKTQAQKDCVALALEVSRFIIQGAVEVNPEYIVSLVKEAVEQSGSAAIKRIRVSPADMEFIEFISLKESFKQLQGRWEFEADQTITSGCVVDTSAGEVDFRLDQAWERVRDKIVKVTR